MLKLIIKKCKSFIGILQLNKNIYFDSDLVWRMQLMIIEGY